MPRATEGTTCVPMMLIGAQIKNSSRGLTLWECLNVILPSTNRVSQNQHREYGHLRVDFAPLQQIKARRTKHSAETLD